MSIENHLERFRYALFIGEAPPESYQPLTQEEYIEHYEQKLERNPAQERKLMSELSAPLLPLFQKQLEDIARMEKLVSGDESHVSFEEEEVLEELYDEVSNLETEEEWKEFTKRFTS